MDNLKGKRTSITINEHVKDKLDTIGKINQSYSELIEQLFDYYVENERVAGSLLKRIGVNREKIARNDSIK